MELQTDNVYDEWLPHWEKWSPHARHAYNRSYKAAMADVVQFARNAAFFAAAAVDEALEEVNKEKNDG